MTTKNTLTVIGFLGRTQACGNTLKTRKPVFLDDGNLHVPTDNTWDMTQTRTLTKWESAELVTRLQRGARINMAVGDILWLAGGGFRAQCQRSIPDSTEASSIDTWRSRIFTAGEMAYRFGPRGQFTAFGQTLANQAVTALHAAWETQDTAAADGAYTLLQNIHAESTRESLIATGMHLSLSGREDDYDEHRKCSMMTYHFASHADFDAAVAATARPLMLV